jgi:hypothetical protein
MNKKAVFILLITFASLLAAFLIAATIMKYESFKTVVQLDTFGEDIELDYWLPEDRNNLVIGQSIALTLKNTSTYPIKFPSDYGISIYQYQNNEWHKIEKKGVYTPGDYELLPRGGDNPGQTSIGFMPDIASVDHPITIRVLVVGTKIDLDSNEQTKVGAYLDVLLKP